MIEAVTAALRRLVPQRLKPPLRAVLDSVRSYPARRALTRAPEEKHHLGRTDLKRLQAEYPLRQPYRYDPDSVLERARSRADRLLDLPGAREATAFLEVGCGDGMVSAELQMRGKAATGVDKRETVFDSRALEAGTQLLQMDAEELKFDTDSFDFAFSYDSFEHISAPDRAFREMVRVVKPGGYIYLDFGPLYNSPWGEHAYRTITAPYCQFLFPRDLMNDHATRAGLQPIDWDHVNRWSIEQYRDLWNDVAAAVEVVSLQEQRDHSQLRIIQEYPSCFTGESLSFDNFVVAHIRAVFQKR